MTPGTVALLAALAVAVAGGIGWRLTNGRMRSPRLPRASGQAELLVPAAARSGLPAGAGGPGRGSDPAATVGAGGELKLTSELIGHPLGERATLLQFSSAFCAPCRATRRILAEVAGLTDGVAHVEIDAESRLDLVRQLNVLRTPTVLVLSGDGQIVRRASGQPRKPDVIAAIGAACPE
jgi:thiol-disulfide isomerase/thioredoxin